MFKYCFWLADGMFSCWQISSHAFPERESTRDRTQEQTGFDVWENGGSTCTQKSAMTRPGNIIVVWQCDHVCLSKRVHIYMEEECFLCVWWSQHACWEKKVTAGRPSASSQTSSDFSYASGNLARLCPRATGAQVFAACTCALVHAEGLSKPPDERWPGIRRSTPVPFKPKPVVIDLDSGISNKRRCTL